MTGNQPPASRPSPEIALPSPAPAAYEEVDELRLSLDRKGTSNPGRGLYPRDGEETVRRIEKTFSLVTIPDQSLNVIVTAGMAGVSHAVVYALSASGRDRLGRGPVLAHGTELYSQATNYFTHLGRIGVTTTGFNSGDPEGLDRKIDDYNPDVIFAETVTNTPNISVLDIHRLLERVRAEEDPPILILDNTLPLSTGINFDELLSPEDRVLIIESGTKNAMNNSSALGVVYSKNRELIDGFRKFKATVGAVTSTDANEAILEKLQAAIPEFHRRNRAVFSGTNKNAKALDRAAVILGDRADFTTTFPTSPDHPNHAYVKEHMPRRHVSKRISPVVFMVANALSESGTQDLLRRITEHPRIREQMREGQIFLGQSFGMAEARLLFDKNAPNVRIAAGYDIEADALADALLEAAADL